MRGFTLAEILIAATIMILVSAMALYPLLQGANLWQVLIAQSDLRSTAGNAMTYMERELRNATHSSTRNPSPNFTIPSKPNNNSIDFYLPADLDNNGYIIDALGNTEWDTSNKIQYQYVPGLKRLRRLEKGNQHVIADNVASIEFVDNSIDPVLYNDQLRIILKVEKATPQQRALSVTLTSVLKTRNR